MQLFEDDPLNSYTPILYDVDVISKMPRRMEALYFTRLHASYIRTVLVGELVDLSHIRVLYSPLVRTTC